MGFVHAGVGVARTAPRWSVSAALRRHAVPTHRVSRAADLPRSFPSADVAVSVGFPFRIPMSLVAHFSGGGVNLHPALLPAFRGPRPIAALCLDGAADRFGGVTLHLLEEEFDAGPILAQESVPYRGRFERWMIELARAHGRLMAPLCDHLDGKLDPVPQDETRASVRRVGAVRLRREWTSDQLARVCRTLGSTRKLEIRLRGQQLPVRGFRGRSPRTGQRAQIGPLALSFDAADARVHLARWLPGTGPWRRWRWRLRLALTPP